MFIFDQHRVDYAAFRPAVSSALEHRPALPGVKPHRSPLTTNHWVLDDPYDSATVDRVIWAEVQRNLAEMSPEETLVILMGEQHPAVSHKMAQIGLLNNLAAWRDEEPDDPSRKILFCNEYQYDLLEIVAEAFFDVTIPSILRGHLSDYDEEGRAALTVFLAHHPFLHTPRTKEQIFAIALRHKISTHYNDASYNGPFLLETDPVACQLAQELYHVDLTQEKAPVERPSGIAIRNAVMVERALKKAKEDGVRIVVQQTGASHLYGHVWKPSPYDQSLTYFFNQKAGCRTLGVFFDAQSQWYKADRIVPLKAWAENPNHIIFENLSDRGFYKRNSWGWHTEKFKTFINGHREKTEEEFLRRLAKSYPPGECPIDLDQPLPTKEEAKQALKDLVARGLAAVGPQID